MANTNKTTLAIYDFNTANAPANSQIVTQFDIYQDAVDYVESFLKNSEEYFNSNGFGIYLFSYDYTSYRYYANAGTVTKTEIQFPDLLG